MAVTKFKTTSSFTNLTKYDSFLAGNTAYDPAAFESIATATGTGSSGTITFSSIPSTYTSLQIRFNAITASDTALYVRINGVTSSGSYNQHLLEGEGTSALAAGGSGIGSTRINIGGYNINVGATYPWTGLIDIHNYTSTTQNKTIRTLNGSDRNGTGLICLSSGLFINTAAVTSVSLIADANFTTSTTVSLYGIKGA